MSELAVRDFPQVKRIDHNLIHTDLLVNAGNHHPLIDGLIVSSEDVYKRQATSTPSRKAA